jgi:hypothetical protein
LAEAQAQLFFFIVVGNALDLGDEGGVVFLPLTIFNSGGYGRA